MKTALRKLGALVLTGLSACAPVVSSGPDPGAGTTAVTPATCDGSRWIGIALPCPAVPGWNAAPLFTGASAPLDAYCAFDFAGPGAPSQNDIFMLQSSGAAALGEDCPVVVPQGPTPSQLAAYEDALATSLRQSLAQRVGTVATLDLPREPKRNPARVVVIDTAPDALAGDAVRPGNDRHGDTLASIVRDIGCDAGGCSVEVASALGMPWLDRDTYTPDGGHVGRLSDVALAIHRAVTSARSEKLVLNLSLGWEDTPGVADCGDDPAALGAPARAVHDAIEQARCKGALVIAAAGNDAGGPTPPAGLICPARWESHALAACTDRAEEPLLHAVGAVDYAGRPIAITRPGGMPRLAALAVGGVAWNAGDPVPPPLTGTSVAAAVASGIAAVTWTNAPALTGAEVMDVLHASGTDIGPADTCPAGVAGPCAARIVSLCRAVAAVSAAPLLCPAPPPSPASSPELAPSVAAALAPILAATPITPAPAHPISTTDMLPRFAAPSPALSGGAFPEPVVPVCPSCGYELSPSGSNVFYVRPTTSISDATLVLESTGTRTATPLSATSPLSAEAIHQYYVIGAPTGVTRAWLTGYTDASNTTAVTQEVIVR
ncbi:MAG: S8/S53 family peptidase [Minicystis sp.]